MPNPHFRCTDEQMAEIEARAKAAGYAKLSPYLRDRALSDGNADLRDSQAKAERVAGSTGNSVPVAEQPAQRPCPHGNPHCPCQDGDPCNHEGERAEPPPALPETREEYVDRRVCSLYGQGFTKRRAKILAEREWREAHPETEETP